MRRMITQRQVNVIELAKQFLEDYGEGLSLLNVYLEDENSIVLTGVDDMTLTILCDYFRAGNEGSGTNTIEFLEDGGIAFNDNASSPNGAIRTNSNDDYIAIFPHNSGEDDGLQVYKDKIVVGGVELTSSQITALLELLEE